MANIRVIRLLNGEELIGDLTKIEDQSVTMENVAIVQVVPSPTNPNSMTIGLIPFAPYAEEKSFDFGANHITTFFTPNNDLVNNYNRIFGGIVVPDKKIVV
jgi:hypothetical protein